ncbi:MAG: NAD(P)-binding domain-containing protein, partial [Rhodospirillales bacterium]|nr:NAD(P)-binding domain-containing protein [Rhodospirillales bacterium]
MTSTIGIIGLGNMGGAISTNLVKAGFAIAGFDIDADMIARA